MAFQLELRAKRALIALACLSLVLWCAMEWLGSRTALILNPLGLVAYFTSFSLCLALSIVLFIHSPRHRLLSEERIAAVALLLPLVWNLI